MNHTFENILITGASGFLGRHLLKQLAKYEKNLVTLGRNQVDPSFRHISCDLSKDVPKLGSTYFDLIIHAAGKAHSVPKTETEKNLFYDVNYKGTFHLTSALDISPNKPKALIYISSVAVYGKESGMDLDETTPTKAVDPYGKSKLLAEQHLMEWGNKHSIIVGILRLPLVSGVNPPGNLEFMIKGIKNGFYFGIGKGDVMKSMVLAEDISTVFIPLAQKGGIYNITDGFHPTFKEIELLIAKRLNLRPPLHIPLWSAILLAKAGDLLEKIQPKKSPITSKSLKKITSSLTFSDQKARDELSWNPRKVVDHFQI